MSLLRSRDLEIVEEQLRSSLRSVTRSSLGVIISTVLAVFMPWVAGSSCYNFAKMCRSSYKVHKLKHKFKELGLRIKKRWIVSGILQGLVTKLGTTVLFLGHEDLLDLVAHAGSWISTAGRWIGQHISTARDTFDRWTPKLQKFKDHVIDAESHRDGNFFLHASAEGADSPVQWMQKQTGTYDNRKLEWHAPGGDVAKQVGLVGATYVVMEYAADMLIEKPHDKVASFGRTFRSRIKRWFRGR